MGRFFQSFFHFSPAKNILILIFFIYKLLPSFAHLNVTVSSTCTGREVKFTNVLNESGNSVQFSTISKHFGQVTGVFHSVGSRNLTEVSFAPSPVVKKKGL